MTPSATNYQRPLSLAHSFAGRDSQRVLLHSEPHRLSNKSDIVQVAGVLALGGIWPPKLNTHTYIRTRVFNPSILYRILSPQSSS